MPAMPDFSRQNGVALIISLLLLLVMTLVGITAMRTTTLEEQMSTNMRDRNLAFQAAEAALRDAQAWLNAQTVRPVPSNTGAGNVWTANLPLESQGLMNGFNDVAFYTGYNWVAGNNSVVYGALTGEPALAGVVQQPRFFIEEMYFVPDDSSPQTRAQGKGIYHYRITARGVGGSVNAVSYLQTMVRRRYN